METRAPVLRLSCGHDLTEVVQADEGAAFCSACEREASADGRGLASDGDADGRDQDGTGPADGGTIVHEGSPEASEGERQDGASLDLVPSPPQPAFGTRGSMPGPKGCWALNARGEPCGSFKRRDGDFCTAHSGLGIGTDPKRWSGEAHAARREQLAARASLRLVMGDRGRIGPRAVMRESVNRNAARLVGRAVGAALSPEVDDAKAAGIAIRLIAEADPPAQATLAVSGELTPESLDGLGLSELYAVAAQLGIDPDATPAASVEAAQ